MRFETLQEWLDWQETLHPISIELKLERVAAVADVLHLRDACPKTLTIAGTNGKGTVATVLSALLQAMGYRVGTYTSPHLLRYNERIAIDGQPVSDADLCAAFAAVDAARGERTLTYFEFGTLAALWLFQREHVDFQVLEVGLGGRLDAVNVWDPDVAVITSVDLDHEQWLGPDRESIGREKAGILRPGRPAVLGEVAPPASVLEGARNLGAEVAWQGRDFALVPGHGDLQWHWAGSSTALDIGPDPGFGLEGARLANVATALAVVEVLGLRSRLNAAVLERGLRAAPAGRLQTIPGAPEWVLDVAHNAQSAGELARWLGAHPVPGPTVAIVAIMADKRRAPMWEMLGEHVDGWVTAPIPSERALSAEELASELRAAGFGSVTVADDADAAMELALKQAGSDGRVLVFGSFLTVQAVLERLPSENLQADISAA